MANFNLDDFAAAGARHLRAAEAEAARLLEVARTEAEAIKKRAHAEGRAAGLAAGAKEADAKVAAAVKREVATRMPVLEQTAQQIGTLEESFLEEFRATLVATALAAAERVVRARLESEPAVVVRWAAEAVQAAKTARRLVIAVHPETLAAHGEALEQLLSSPGLPEDSRIEPDESVEPAGVVVRRDGGTVDLQLNEQLTRLAELLA
ncbi:FliH/SctL family protein [Candidatus Laterigemmans baculatus]|uniref:FliH/SctL family protein n=1 Tax=Candidatus Laterigemmans baculatus TaxID=2770505 RepID=UPI0013D8ED1F|nr:FliH/SctL family protein [Candidatus Laterigemmans baculatus]